MKAPEFPDNEAERTQALEDSGLLYSPAEARFDRIARLAKKYFGVKSALVSLVYKDEQWFKARVGVKTIGSSREVSFCGHAILGDSTFIVENASEDDRFSDNPLVLEDQGIRFYAGQPVRNRFGVTLGTLCLLDPEPRNFSSADQKDLQDFAKLVEAEISKRSLSPVVEEYLQGLSTQARAELIDADTGVWNQSGILEVLTREMRAASGRNYGVSVFKIQIQNFENMNDQVGDSNVSEVLKHVSAHILDCVAQSASLAYCEAGQFILICPFQDEERYSQVFTDLRMNFDNALFEAEGMQAHIDISLNGRLIESERLTETEASYWLESL